MSAPTVPDPQQTEDVRPTMLDVRDAVRAANAHRSEYEIRADFDRYREELADDDLDDRDSFHQAIAEGWGHEHPRHADHPRNRKFFAAREAAERDAVASSVPKRQIAAN